MANSDDGFGMQTIWAGDRCWLLTWELHEQKNNPVLNQQSPNAWIEWSAGPPVAPDRHRHADPQVIGEITKGRLEFRTVGSVEWDSGWGWLFSQTMDAVRRLSTEVLR